MKIVTGLDDIQKNQMIICEYISSNGNYGGFSNFGTSEKDLITLPTTSASGSFYFVCVGYTPNGFLKLIADRVIQVNISWETLNNAGLCSSAGKNVTADDYSPQYIYRLPHSALIAGQNGEWDAAVVQYDYEGAIADKASFWNIKGIGSWSLNTSGSNAAQRIVRATNAVDDLNNISSTAVSATCGFRPVLLYNPKGRIFTRGNPNCPLELATDVRKIRPGQAISCEYTAAANTFGEFDNLGTAAKETLSDLASIAPDGTFYFICAGYTPSGNLKLVADRVIQSSISWEKLNAAGMCTSAGATVNISDLAGLTMRLPHSVNTLQATKENHGEWDAIISYGDLGGLITPSDNDIWNCRTTVSLTMGTFINSPFLRVGRGFQEKLRPAMGQKQYDASTVYEKVGFRPVLIVKKDSYFFYLKEDQSCYKVADNVLSKVADDWPALSMEEKAALFLKSGSTTLGKTTVLSALKKFKILIFVEGKEIERAKMKMSAIPLEKVIYPKSLISIENFEGIDMVKVLGNYGGQGCCKILVTTDLKTYKTFKDGEWQIINCTDLAKVKSDGIDNKSISGITRAEWDVLTVEETGIGFAYIPVLENVSDRCEIDAISIQIDMRGTWDMALPGMDYTYCYPRNNTLRVKLLSDGAYKINYSEGVIEM